MFAQRYRTFILILLTASLGQAFGERAALSVAGPSLAKSLHIDAVSMGWLFSAFGWSYVIAHLPAGWLIDRVGARRTVLAGLVVCALCSVLIGAAGWMAHAFVLILVLRVLVGVAQAPYGPAAGIAIAAWFPARERGMAGAIFGSAGYLALAVFNPLQGWVTERHGWQAMFGVMAVMGLATAALWWRGFELPGRHPKVTRAELDQIAAGGAMIELGRELGNERGAAASRASSPPPLGLFKVLKLLFSSRMVVGLLVAQYCVASITWFFVSWFPTYLVQVWGYTVLQAGSLAALPAVCGIIGAVTSGFFSDRLLDRTGSLSRARKLPVIVGMSMSAIGLLACVFVDEGWMVIALMSFAFFGKGFGTLGWTLVADVAPVSIIGLTGGIYNAIGNVSGIVTPVAIGYLVASDVSFDSALYFVAAHAALALVSNAWIVGKVERLKLPTTAA